MSSNVLRLTLVTSDARAHATSVFTRLILLHSCDSLHQNQVSPTPFQPDILMRLHMYTSILEMYRISRH